MGQVDIALSRGRTVLSMAIIREQTWDVLAEFLKNWSYGPQMTRKPWLMRDDESNYAVLHIYIHAPNSYDENLQDRHTDHEFLVPVATYNYQSWRRWVYEQCKTIAVHEVGEWFQDNGERIFAPHHGNGEIPYVEWATRPDRAEAVKKSPGED